LNDHDRAPAQRTLQGVATDQQVDVLPSQRAGDTERNRYVDHLNRLHGLGYIPADEHGHRVTAALHARSVLQLNELISDLPALAQPARRLDPQVMLRPTRRAITLLVISSLLSVSLTVVPGASTLAANMTRTPLWVTALGFLSLTAGLVWDVANAVWWNSIWNNS